MTVPRVTCMVPSAQGHAPLDETASHTPLRLTRLGTADLYGSSIDFGQYFAAIQSVISEGSYGSLVDAASKQLSRDVSLADIDEILICLEKHGSDYHPARIEVRVDDACAAFVMNVAVTERGKARLCGEFEVLQHLNRKYSLPFLPQTYFQGVASYQAEQGDDAMPMFLADWFQGYHEFHLSIDETDGSQKLALWDTDKGHQHLSRLQSRQIYCQAAKIMTLYYDIESFEQIFPWHHAAGDFVVKVEEESLDVRLVTARQYAPMLERSDGVSIHEALLLFLLNLTVRIRLDRLDGTGAVAWAHDHCVDATLDGFLEGLRFKERQETGGTVFAAGFLQLCRSLTREDLAHYCHALIDACNQTAPDMPVIRRHLDKHVRRLHGALKGLSRS